MELLDQDGYKTRGASNGRQAVRMFREQPDDVVLCDYRLPDMDGLAVCATLQGIHRPVKLIMTTAYCRAELIAKARELGVIKIINKPIALDQLLDTLHTACASPAKKDLPVI